MITQIDSFLQMLTRHPSLSMLVSALVASAALVFAALAMHELLRSRSARSRCLLWRLVILGLLLLGVWRLLPELSPPASVVKWEVEMPAVEPLPEVKLPVTPTLPLIIAKKPLWQKGAEWAEENVWLLWVSGAGFWLLWRLVRSLMGLVWLRGHSRPAPVPMERLLRSLSAEKWPAMRLVDGLHSPLLTGWQKPVIWLPAEAAEWAEGRLRSVLRHELAHQQRGDVLWHWMARLVECVWWWQPLTRLASKRLHAETEHAADDQALLAGEDAAGYARTLVEIAAGMPSQTITAGGVAMLRSDQVKQRVQELMRVNLWRGRIGLGAMIALAVLAAFVALVALTRLEFTPKKPVFRSLAKLVAGGRGYSESDQWQAQIADFYGTIIETIESAEMIRKAHDRVHALHPNLKDADVEISVRQTKGSAIFNILASGEDPKYTQIFLNALLDEFMAFRAIIREQAQGKELSTFLQEVVNKQKVMEERNDALSKFTAANNVLTLTNGNNEAAAFLSGLKTKRAALLTQQAELRLAMENIPVAIISRASNPNAATFLTTAEQDYITQARELRRLGGEMRYLLKTLATTDPKVVEAKDKADKASFLLESLVPEISEEMNSQLASNQRAVAVLDEQIAEREKEALAFGAKMAEHEKLKKEAEMAQNAYQIMFEKAETFQNMFNMQSDYVAIQERATIAAEYTDSGRFPIWKLWSAKAKAD